MNLATWTIRNPAPAILLFLVLTLLGVHSFFGLPIQNFPDITLPTVTVNASLPGASPSMLETQVTKKIENAVSTLNKVQHITSVVSQGSSSTTITFDLSVDPDTATNDVRNAVSQIQGQLPAGMQAPMVSKVTMTGRALATYAVSSKNLSTEQLSWYIDDTVSKALMAVPGVANVARQGGQQREILVELNPQRLQALGVTAAQISTLLNNQSTQDPAGQMVSASGQSTLNVDTSLRSLQDVLDAQIALPSGRVVRLSDVASVKDTTAPPQQAALLGDKPVVSFQVFRAVGYGDVQVADAVKKAVAGLQKQDPGVRMTLVTTTVTNVLQQYHASMQALYEGALLAVLVVFIFLRDWRATLVSALALPLSAIPTFWAMHLFGFSLNTLTLLALTLVVGVLVDDAIVEVENVVRHTRMGKDPLTAAGDAATEIAPAVIATTLTLVAVFLPTAFMGGIPGKFFNPFGWTVALAVLASLLVARTLTPVLAAKMLKTHPHADRHSWIHGAYLSVLKKALARPGRTLAATGAFLVFSAYLATHISVAFIPPAHQGQTVVSLQTAPGSTFAQTQSIAAQARNALQGLSGIEQVYTTIGNGQSLSSSVTTAGDVTSAALNVSFTPEGSKNQDSVEKAMRKRLSQVPGAIFSIGTGGSGESLQLALASEDAGKLEQAVESVEQGIRTLRGLGNVTSTAATLRPQVNIWVDSYKAAALGVTPQAIAQTLRIATNGDFDQALPQLNLSSRQVPVVVRLPEKFDRNAQTLAQLQVPARSGTVALGAIAHLQLSSGAAQINRYDRSRSETITVQLNGRPLGEVLSEVNALPAMKHLPSGVFQLQTGDVERMHDLFSSFGAAMALGVFCVYAVLVLLFHDFVQPVTILMALPLSMGGAFAALLLGGFSFSISTLIGLLMLMGIVTKNSILLVEYAVKARDQGVSRAEALIDACNKRVRPIMMTTVAMTAGMLPIALSLEGDSSFRAPMAVTVIGGLWTSTLLSLLVIPVLYSVVDTAKTKLTSSPP